ncbi:hypothetical protein [Aliamphritea spongicola]|nr:hypothetical protein [Aliamphritea spongicola]
MALEDGLIHSQSLLSDAPVTGRLTGRQTSAADLMARSVLLKRCSVP